MEHPGKEFYENWGEQKLEDAERTTVILWNAVNLANLSSPN
jgi:hypothetical protein